MNVGMKNILWPGTVSGYIGPLRKGLILLLAAGCMVVTYYFHFVIREDIVFSHLFYLPIVLAGVWWGWKAVLVGAALGANLVASNLISGQSYAIDHDLTRAGMFVVVGAVLGAAVMQKNRLEAKVLEEHRQYIRQMEAHLTYVERVSHELRNPLQVTLGVLEFFEDEPEPAKREEFVRLLNRSADNMRTRIQELTNDVPNE